MSLSIHRKQVLGYLLALFTLIPLVLAAPAGIDRARAALFDCAQVSEIPLADCQALVELYNNTGGPAWTNNSSWLSTSTPCSSPWFGIECSNGAVSDISLGSNNLAGTIPAEIGDLTAVGSIVLQDNALTGALPPEIGNLNQLDFLSLSTNQLSGSLPASLGGLSSVTGLWLDSNQFTGGIPAAFGSLTQLSSLLLFNNHLSGGIPSELTTLTTLADLELHGNMLSGSIPTGLGNLSALLFLTLGNNAFSGDIPANLANLGQVIIADFGYNMLTASDAGVIAWLGATDPDWSATQTIPPPNVTTGAITGSSIALSWTPIAYTADGGYYPIEIAAAPGGPYSVHGTTADKTASGYIAGGLNPGTTYYFRVRAFTPPHGSQQNGLLSLPSSVVSASTTGATPTATPAPSATPTAGPTSTSTPGPGPTATPGPSPTPSGGFFIYLPVVVHD